MIAEILQRDFILEALSETRRELHAMAESSGRRSANNPVPPEFDHLEAADFEAAQNALQAAHEKERIAGSGQQGFDLAAQNDRRDGSTEPASLNDRVFLSHDPGISALQSALDQYYTLRAPDRISQQCTEPQDERRRADQENSDTVMVTDKTLVTPLDDDRRYFQRFSGTDIRWVACLFAEAKHKFTHRHPFISTPNSQTLPARSRLVVVGDWASGLPRAVHVSQWMRHHLSMGLDSGIAQHAIHLGDTYYSGWPSEYEKRFLPHWPVRPEWSDRIGSWSLNANHDMYSGGYGYYDTLLRDGRFSLQGGCSYFSLESPFWRILGIDTGWTEGDLEDPQATWIASQCREARQKSQKVLLLSHHHLFSAYEPQNTRLPGRLGELLRSGAIHAWIWGHEHRCVVYRPTAGLQYAACIGHGGIPVYMNHAACAPLPHPAIYEDRRLMKQGLESWAYMGFCILDFEDRTLTIRHLDENGLETRADRIGE